MTDVFGLTKTFGLTGLAEVTEELGLTETGKTLRYALGLTLRLTLRLTLGSELTEGTKARLTDEGELTGWTG